jgi:hypothetical protein
VKSVWNLSLVSLLLVACGQADNEPPPEQVAALSQAIVGEIRDISPRCSERTLPGGIMQVRCEQGNVVCNTDYWPGGRADTRCYKSGVLQKPVIE